MCGIFGWVNFNNKSLSKNKSVFLKLNKLSTRRGKDASGVWTWNERETNSLVLPVSGHKLVKTIEFRKGISPSFKEAKIILGHNRLATNGGADDLKNNQPIVINDLVLAHNGIVVNSDYLANLFNTKKHESDSMVLAEILLKLKKENKSLKKSIQYLSRNILGTLNLILVEKMNDNCKVVLASNNGSLYLGKTKSRLFFASERYFLKELEKTNKEKIKIIQLKANEGFEIDFKKKSCEKFLLKKTTSLNESKHIKDEKINLLNGHKIDFEKINKIKRCIKCILPETTPFIKFDENGVCNYCNEHQKIKYKGLDELEKLIKKHRSKDGKPDCIMAFSGGRDSSYGLHYLVKNLKLHPVAVTFDWGMLSDVGRRNQSRMLAKLGIEHIVVSADIPKVRKDINKNLKAWLKKPDLGMVPLLMQADKITEYYVDKIKKELGVELVFFCRGNELEKEEFKSGYCGVKNADPGGVIHNYYFLDKIKLLFYYAKGILLNPAYINSSLWSSFCGYLVTFVIPHNYIYLWHYVPWNEKEIIKLLKKEYGWEGDDENGITWRIDDGSPSFYNYLYYQIQGFTENDSFRSRQIRENVLTRKKALILVNKENQPRYKALSWYFEKIGLNGNDVLNKIDKIKKRY